MRICIIGKYPPIQGGVSMRTYWSAHALAARGHEVHVVTNAKEALPPFRMHMRAQDWRRCAGRYGAGSVTVHWSDPADRAQAYIPMASPFVSKLATLAATAHAARPFDVIFSHYLEPYGIAGHLAAQMTGRPHVVRTAGSDAGRLWRHPQLEALYDHVLRSAKCVVATGAVAERAAERGVDPRRIVPGGGYVPPDDLFKPRGPRLDLDALRAEIDAGDAGVREGLWGALAPGEPYLGIYGKLGDNKGSFALLDALARLEHAGTRVGLLALAHGRGETERRFRARVQELGLAGRVLQIPFLPHWRVPEFLRGCLAVCCLEQDFPIGFHSPITPLEVLSCGRCLVGSTEVIRKLPQWERLAHGYNCVAVEDVGDVGRLAERLAAIVDDPQPAAAVGARGAEFAREVQGDIAFPRRLEAILKAAVRRGAAAVHALAPAPAPAVQLGRFPLTQMAAAAMARKGSRTAAKLARKLRAGNGDLAGARRLLAELGRARPDRRTKLPVLAQAVAAEIAIAEAQARDAGAPDGGADDPLFRLRSRRWAMRQGDLPALVPVRARNLRVLHFDFDVAGFRGAKALADLPPLIGPQQSHVVVFCGGVQHEPLIVDRSTARFLELSDGRRTVMEILRQLYEGDDGAAAGRRLAWAEHLFGLGLIALQDADAAKSPADADNLRGTWPLATLR